MTEKDPNIVDAGVAAQTAATTRTQREEAAMEAAAKAKNPPKKKKKKKVHVEKVGVKQTEAAAANKQLDTRMQPVREKFRDAILTKDKAKAAKWKSVLLQMNMDRRK